MHREYKPRIALACMVVSLLALCADARAQSSPDGDDRGEAAAPAPGSPATASDTRPWIESVSEEAQEKAQQLFAEGNDFLDNLRFANAAAKYREAIDHWAHPAIQYNLAIALIKLDQSIDAYLAINQALRYGAAPLESEQYNQALNYQQLLRKQIGEIELTSSQDGVVVTLDGKKVLTGPGTIKMFVLVGEHQVVAGKRGFQTVTRTLPIPSGKTVRMEMRLFTERELTVSTRHWQRWKPWAVTGIGVSIGLAGGALHYWGARPNLRSFDAELEDACPLGCPDNADISPSARLRRGMLQQKIAWGSYVAGGLVVSAGLVGLVLNLPRKVRIDRSAEEMNISFRPTPSAGGLTLGISGTF
jgi:hypothetical protein